MQKEITFTMKTELIEEFSYHLYSQEKTAATIRKYSTDLKTFWDTWERTDRSIESVFWNIKSG